MPNQFIPAAEVGKRFLDTALKACGGDEKMAISVLQELAFGMNLGPMPMGTQDPECARMAET